MRWHFGNTQTEDVGNFQKWWGTKNNVDFYNMVTKKLSLKIEDQKFKNTKIGGIKSTFKPISFYFYKQKKINN
jgi:hypothetical protein